jgi:uncharacterized protein
MKSAHYEDYIQDLLRHPDILRLQNTNAHWHRDRLAHCYAVGKMSYRLAKLVHANRTVAARAGFLHDWYHGHQPDRQRFVNADNHHFRISVQAAENYGEHPKVLHAVRTHFWPWGRTMPKTSEAWIVWMADNIVWFEDLFVSFKIAIRDGFRSFIYGPR